MGCTILSDTTNLAFRIFSYFGGGELRVLRPLPCLGFVFRHPLGGYKIIKGYEPKYEGTCEPKKGSPPHCPARGGEHCTSPHSLTGCHSPPCLPPAPQTPTPAHPSLPFSCPSDAYPCTLPLAQHSCWVLLLPKFLSPPLLRLFPFCCALRLLFPFAV